jgi:hydrogenase maturation protein HypF
LDSKFDRKLIRRRRIRLAGTVQGIGFRPFVYRLARELDLNGFVLNDSRGAQIEIEGPLCALDRFETGFTERLPPLAHIAEKRTEDIPPEGAQSFEIRKSAQVSDRLAFVTPDAHVCEDCLAEMRDRQDRRYAYPFINCTNCGPRYTIITGVPYDRPNTTMDAFPMCDACAAEYTNPLDRRFHAQPIACPRCGPQVLLTDSNGARLACDDPIAHAARALQDGRIVAVKGLGGFHLAVDAASEAAVVRLRQRKWREDKPLALMARDLQCARSVVVLEDNVAAELQRPARPIVLTRRRPNAPVAQSVAPGLVELGVMLPYTPLHHLLLERGPHLLVMTSGNPTGEPLAHRNEEALERLGAVADCFLFHDRQIHNPCDDSVVRVAADAVQMVRRARGYAPQPLAPTRFTVTRSVLAVGAELKNTICLTRNGQLVLSQHLGDLTNAVSGEAFEVTIARLSTLLGVEPEAVVCDYHPQYYSTRFAHRFAGSRPLIEVQHHHAHLAAAMVEHDLPPSARVLGVIWDGTGYGLDETTWGGEFIGGGYDTFERFAHVRPLPLPGGDAATRHPWRVALAALWTAGYDPRHTPSGNWIERQDPQKVALVWKMLQKGWRCPLSSGAGRFFDGAAAIIDLRAAVTDAVRYEAQAAIELEAACADVEPTTEQALLPCRQQGDVLDLTPTLVELVRLVVAGVPKAVCAARFIDTMAVAGARLAVRLARKHGLDHVVFSGGCFQNVRLSGRMRGECRQADLTVLEHRRVPPNDGAVSLGQAAVALVRLG